MSQNKIQGDILISDPINELGASYAADYSANYTNRSIPDVEYIKGLDS
jgi:hypothetical protein